MSHATNRPRPRVFVSSVMKGYGQYREATRVGIRQAECDAVLAEDFAAQSASSRNAFRRMATTDSEACRPR